MSLELWKTYLRYDPTRWLLETNDPSILLWYQLDIANRPQDAPGVRATRERVLYSDPVQKIFAAQDQLGFWGDPESLAQPYSTATLWNLALLAELGIAPTSRRARNASEFLLQNFLDADGTFRSLNPVEIGYCLRALAYFNYTGDSRVITAARTLTRRLNSIESRVAALWGCRAFTNDREISEAVQENLETLINDKRGMASKDTRHPAPYTFPQFDPRDELFYLRVLSEYNTLTDPRLAPLIEQLVKKQNASAQWELEHSLNFNFVIPLETVNEPSRWITLNALRVIVRLVHSGADYSRRSE